jgi:hypothetical protein
VTTLPVRGRPYWNPYAAGAGLGLVLLSAILVMGHGIGASGAAAAAVAAGVDAVAPAHAAANAYLGPYLLGGSSPMTSWIVVEVAGIFVGGLVSARLAGRLATDVERGPRAGRGARLVAAVAGGCLMGFASRLARGCTSGQPLTGGALLSVGSWVFMLALFAAAHATAPLVRKQWT